MNKKKYHEIEEVQYYCSKVQGKKNSKIYHDFALSLEGNFQCLVVIVHMPSEIVSCKLLTFLCNQQLS